MVSSARGERRSAVAILIAPAAIVGAGALLALRLYFQPPTVPGYTVTAQGDASVVRPGGLFEVEIRPNAPVTGAVGARAFLLRGTEVRPWDPPFEVARDGSVRLAGAADVIFAGVPPGDWEVAIAVGRPETLPTSPNDVIRRRDATVDAGPAAWQLVRQRIRLGS